MEAAAVNTRLAAATAAAALTVALAGCNFITPQATTFDYDPSDGISGTTGTVAIRNAVLVSEDDMASLAVTFVNSGEPVALLVTVDGEAQRVDLDEGLTAYGFPEQQLVFPLTADVGSLAPVEFAADGIDNEVLEVQVFSTESAGYEALGPIVSEEADESPEPSEG